MVKIWRELADPNKHVDFMSTSNVGGVPVEASANNLIPKWIYFVQVCSFRFQFSSLEQIKECQQYFLKKIHPSTRKAGTELEHYWQPWYCKLPKGITKESKRQRVLKALELYP